MGAFRLTDKTLDFKFGISSGVRPTVASARARAGRGAQSISYPTAPVVSR